MSNKILNGGGQWLLLRRQFLEKKGSNEEMKEWITLVDESKTVENLSTIEFDLANAESHDEFRLYIEIDKNANADRNQHNLKAYINGMDIGYYMFNTQWNTLMKSYVEIEKKPIPKLSILPFSTTELKYGVNNLKAQVNYITDERGTGKLTFYFPDNNKYTGTIKVQLYAR